MTASATETQNIKGRVLVMDDERSLRTTSLAWLKMKGYAGDGAADGKEAVTLYREAMDSDRRYDAVVLDLTVPAGMGGQEAFQELLRIDPQVLGIVTSGFPSDPVMAEFKAHGFSAALAKPFRLQELTDTLEGLLKHET
ncbi:MAG: response regulator [Verrucomicrobiota bacterium]|jgi:DNA-binding NtrC family response regulator|nr:response regulator [Verrucomicrobiota bacterium]